MTEKKDGNTIVCPQCGGKNPILSITCKNCGGSLVEEKLLRTAVVPPARKSKPKVTVIKKDTGSGKQENPSIVTLETPGTTITDLYHIITPQPGLQPITVRCARCGHSNDMKSQMCEICHTPITFNGTTQTTVNAKEHPFGASLGVGCLATGIGYVVQQVIMLLLGLVNMYSMGDTFIIIIGWALLASIETGLVLLANRIVKERGYDGLNKGGVALAVVISLILHFVMSFFMSSAILS